MAAFHSENRSKDIQIAVMQIFFNLKELALRLFVIWMVKFVEHHTLRNRHVL
jgi:hypothetical protein